MPHDIVRDREIGASGCRLLPYTILCDTLGTNTLFGEHHCNSVLTRWLTNAGHGNCCQRGNCVTTILVMGGYFEGMEKRKRWYHIRKNFTSNTTTSSKRSKGVNLRATAAEERSTGVRVETGAEEVPGRAGGRPLSYAKG